VKWLFALVLVDQLAGRPALAGGHHCSGSNGEATGTSESRRHVEYVYFGDHHGGTIVPETVGGCEDNTDVVGYRHCTKYGAWASSLRLPPLFFETGGTMRHFRSQLGDRDGTVSHGVETFTYRTVMPTESPSDLAMTSSLRFGAVLPHHFYSGLEAELGGLVSQPNANAQMTSTGSFGAPELTQSHGMVVGGLAFVGLRGDIGLGSLAVEGAGGVRDVIYNFTSTYHECETSSSISIVRPVVEARARADVWLGPWLTLGATLGANVLAKSDWMAGLYLGLHSRAYGGSRY